ncbi:N-acetylglutamate synthase, mitochondrial isoform X2 [Boleophthalmus pectinirostris]|uniref:N-acetylglutamate synthase, mitochondrial isoform X2 n=1 Tax=Boleophthalmus pectinirostris TaxID=150288 RepID=UPI002431F49A|nr:N-acetylglutamate synthase, mitochondrial isoform X2 [Boleophthalmus pectinirostris]
MAKVSSGSSSCRVMVIAGKYLSSPGPLALTRTSGSRQRDLSGAQRRRASSDTAGSKKTTASGHEPLGLFSATDRHLPAKRNLIYRDVKAFLSEVGGDPREARYWLTQFQRASSSQSPAFAVLEVDSSVFERRDMVQSLAFGLSFLQRMDMKPVVVMGWSGCWDSDPQSSRTLVEHSQQLTEALHLHSASVLPFFSAQTILLQRGAQSPPAIAVDTSLLQWSLDCGLIPIVCPVGRDEQQHSIMMDSTEVTAAISRALQPHKVMFLNKCGGLRCHQHKVLGSVSLPGDLPALSTAEWLMDVERRRVTSIATLLNHLPSESSAVITSADTLLTELFSHKGSGTLFKNGDPIHRYTSLDEIDVERLLVLINKSFEKTLNQDYIASLKGRLHTVYLSEGVSTKTI